MARYSNLVSPLIAVFCVVTIVSLQLPRAKSQQRTSTRTDYLIQEQEKKAKLQLLDQVPSFGYGNLIADWVFLDFVQYYGDAPARAQTGNTLIPYYFGVTVKRDPRFTTAYLFLSPATSLFAGRPDLSVKYTSEALSYMNPEMPLAYQLWNYKGTDEVLFLGDLPSAKKSFQKAAQWASYSDTEEARSFAQSSQGMANFLATNPDSKSIMLSAWLMVLGSARDEQTTKLALDNIKKLGGIVTITDGRVTVRLPDSPLPK